MTRLTRVAISAFRTCMSASSAEMQANSVMMALRVCAGSV